MDYGKDFYAAVTWNDVPDGRRIAIGWMNNWNYAGAIPTSPWRSAMSVPRELALRTIDGQSQLVQEAGPRAALAARLAVVHGGTTGRSRRAATTLPVRAARRSRSRPTCASDAERAGLKVRTGNGEETVIGYDAAAGELYVDRTRSGTSDFSRDFPGVQRAPLAARHGKVRLRILVDWSSVEVFADGGRRVITDQIFRHTGSRPAAGARAGGPRPPAQPLADVRPTPRRGTRSRSRGRCVRATLAKRNTSALGGDRGGRRAIR